MECTIFGILLKHINDPLSVLFQFVWLHLYIVSTEKNWCSQNFPRFFKLEKFIPRSVFGKLQLIQISLNFITSCCNLKSRGLQKNQARLFCLCFIFEIIHFKQNCIIPRFFMWKKYCNTLWGDLEIPFYHEL